MLGHSPHNPYDLLRGGIIGALISVLLVAFIGLFDIGLGAPTVRIDPPTMEF